MQVVKKRSIRLWGQRSSLSIEDEFWSYLKQCAKEEGLSLAAFVSRRIDTPDRENNNLSSACRLYAFKHSCGRGLQS